MMLPRIYEIEQRLSSLQQGPMDVSASYTELVTLWEEYKIYIKISVCTCGRCEYNAAALWEQLQQRSRVTKFLMGLNEVYESSRRHILMLKPVPSIEEVFNMIVQDERQKTIKPSKADTPVFQSSTHDLTSSVDDTENQAFATTHNGGYRPRQRPMCTHCSQAGHTMQKCFKLIGYPPGHRFYNNGNHAPRPMTSSTMSFVPRGQNMTGSRPQQFPNQ